MNTHVVVKTKRLPVKFSNSILDDIFSDFIYGYDPVDLISTFFQSTDVRVDTFDYPIMDQYLLKDGSMLYKFVVSSFSKDEIDVEIVNNELIVKCQKKKDKEDSKKDIAKILVKKIKEQDFEFKSFISDKMDASKIECSIHDGHLHILIPLKEEMKPVSKKLQIK